MPTLPRTASRRQSSGSLGISFKTGASTARKLLPEEERKRQGTVDREVAGLTGYFTGMGKGLLEITRHPTLLSRLPGAMVSSFARTITGRNWADAAAGKHSYTEAFLEDLGNIAAVFSLGATAAGVAAGATAKAASAATAAGDVARAATLTSRAANLAKVAEVSGKLATPVRTFGVAPLAKAGGKALTAAAEGTRFAGALDPALRFIGGVAHRGRLVEGLKGVRRTTGGIGSKLGETFIKRNAAVDQIGRALREGKITVAEARAKLIDAGLTSDEILAQVGARVRANAAEATIQPAEGFLPAQQGVLGEAGGSLLGAYGPRVAERFSPYRVPQLAARGAEDVARTVDTFAKDAERFDLDPELFADHLQEVMPIKELAAAELRKRGMTPPDDLDRLAGEVSRRLAKSPRGEEIARNVERQARPRSPYAKPFLGERAPALGLEEQAWLDTVESLVGNESLTRVMDDLYRSGIIRTMDGPALGWAQFDPHDMRLARVSSGSTALADNLAPNTPKSLAEMAVERGDKLFIPEKAAGALRGWTAQRGGLLSSTLSGQVLDQFRGLVLYHSPRWLRNNLFGNLALAAVSGAAFNPRNWMVAWQQAKKSGTIRIGREFVLRQADRSLLGALGPRAMGERFAGVPRSVAGGSVTAEAVGPGTGLAGTRFAKWSKNMNEVTDGFFRTMVYRHELQRGVRRGRLEAVKAEAAGDTGALKRYNDMVDEKFVDRMFEKTQRGGTMTPDELRLSEDAVKAANRSMVDYANLNPVERHVIRQIIPFYTWQKGILKLAMSMPLDHPLRFAVLENISRVYGGFSQEEREKYPEWMWGVAQVPGLGTTSLRGVNPFQDAVQLMTSDGLSNSLSPVIDIPVQFLAPSYQATGAIFGAQEVSPGGRLVPQRGFEDILTEEFRRLPIIQPFVQANLNPAGLLGPSVENIAASSESPTPLDQSAARRGLNALIGFRTFGEQELAERERREREQRLIAYNSLLNQENWQRNRTLGIARAAGGTGTSRATGIF